MPQPEGAELDAIRARREELKEKYLHPPAERPATTVRGVHHLALICRDVEETIRFYQEFLGFPLVELVENRDYAGSSHFFFDIGNRNLLGFFDFPGHDHPDSPRPSAACSTSRCPPRPRSSTRPGRGWTRRASSTWARTAGVENSLYIRDPNGVGIEFYARGAGRFEGRAAAA